MLKKYILMLSLFGAAQAAEEASLGSIESLEEAIKSGDIKGAHCELLYQEYKLSAEDKARLLALAKNAVETKQQENRYPYLYRDFKKIISAATFAGAAYISGKYSYEKLCQIKKNQELGLKPSMVDMLLAVYSAEVAVIAGIKTFQEGRDVVCMTRAQNELANAKLIEKMVAHKPKEEKKDDKENA